MTRIGPRRLKRDQIEGMPLFRIVELCQGALQRIPITWNPPRMAALVAFLYMSGRRISEVLGGDIQFKGEVVGHAEAIRKRDLYIQATWVTWRGTILKMHAPKPVVKVCRINRASKSGGLLWPFIEAHLETLQDEDYLFRQIRANKAITRQYAHMQMRMIDEDVRPRLHWFRHQRMTHLSEVLDPYDLKDEGHFARMDSALWYVHRSPTQRAKAMKAV